jgi:glycosyltransferase involved in cell wall biosynthesis
MVSVSVIILNLNEIDVVEQSLRRLKKEPWNVIVVDNGSDDDSWERLQKYGTWATLVRNVSNKGPSVGRNAGLKMVGKTDFIFLLDGDIQYIPGTIAALSDMLLRSPKEVGCIGVHNPRRYDGTQRLEEADQVWPENPGKMYKDFDMAWTQYGLFRAAMLRDIGFYQDGVFGECGIGYEDDWLWHEMKKRWVSCYYVPDVLYYHERHGGARFLKEKGLPVRSDERYEIFKKHWKQPAWNEKELHLDWKRDNLQLD